MAAGLRTPRANPHFLKRRSECFGLTLKAFHYQIPAHSSNLIDSCSLRPNLPSLPQTHLPTSPPVARCFSRLSCPFLLISLPPPPGSALARQAQPLPDGRPRWGASSWPPRPPVSLITQSQGSSLASELLRPDSQEVGKNSRLSQKHLEKDIVSTARCPPVLCRPEKCSLGM